MAQIKKVELKDINAALEKLSGQIDAVESGAKTAVFLSKTKPSNPKPGQVYWPGDGRFMVFHPGGWEIYSKD